MHKKSEIPSTDALHKKSIINPCLACEAGGSVEPGASAPGKNGLEYSARESGRKHEILRLSPVSRAQSVALRCPGADAPGFMLSPASQAKTFVISTFCAKPTGLTGSSLTRLCPSKARFHLDESNVRQALAKKREPTSGVV